MRLIASLSHPLFIPLIRLCGFLLWNDNDSDDNAFINDLWVVANTAK